MKYFDEEKNIIKALAGTSTYYFIRPPEPVVDNMGGLGSAVYHNQSVQRLQEVNREQAAMEAQRRREEAIRRQPQLRQGRSESELQRSRLQQRQAELDQRRNEQRSTMINFDPTGTAHTQAAVLAMPYVAEATRNYFNRPIGDIIGGEVESGVNLIMAPWTGMGHHLLQMGIAGQDGRYFDAAGHALGAAANGALIFAGTRTPVGEVPAVQTASRAVNTTARRVKNTTSNAVNRVKQTAQTAGLQVGEGLRSFGNQVQEGFNYTFGQGPMLQPAYVGGVPGTMRTPWTLYEPATAPRTQNFLGFEIKNGGLHRKPGQWGKPAESAPAAEATSRSSFNGYYDESGNPVTLYERTDPRATYYRRDESFGTAYEKVPQTQEIYDEALNPVDINTAVPGTKYVYSDMTPATVFREVQTPVPTQLYYRVGESSPREGFFDIYEPSPSNAEGFVTAKGTPATNIYREVNPQTANRYRLYEGSDGTLYGQGLYDLYDSPLKSNRRQITPTNEELVPYGNPSLRQAYRASGNPSNAGNRKVLHQRAGNGDNGTVVSDPIDPSFLEDIRSRGAWLPGNRKFNLTALGVLGGTGLGRWGVQNVLGFSQWRPNKKEENPQQTNDTTPENTPTNTPQTPDTTGRAERMAQRRKELGITE